MSLAGLLNQTISLYNRSSYGFDGRAAYGSASDVKGRLESKVKRILMPDGTTMQVDAFLMLKPDVTIANDDKIVYDSVAYRVIDIFKVPGGSGQTHHLEVRLTKWPST